jgi:hypothetical protein
MAAPHPRVRGHHFFEKMRGIVGAVAKKYVNLRVIPSTIDKYAEYQQTI